MTRRKKLGLDRHGRLPVIISGKGRCLDLGAAAQKIRRERTVTLDIAETGGDGMKEKRKSERRYLVAEVQVKKPDSGDTTYAMAVNISDEGIGLYTKKAVAVDEMILVKITVLIKGTLIVSEEIAGTVRWVEPIDKNYAAGVKFEEAITKDKFPVLSKCLDYAKLSKTRV